MSTAQKLSSPVGRIFIAMIFIMAGYNKIGGYAATQGYMESVGVPGILLPLVIGLEIIGGLAVLVGWQTRIAALALAGFSLAAAVLFHNNVGDPMQMILFMKNVAIAGGMLFLVANGPGAYALDTRIRA